MFDTVWISTSPLTLIVCIIGGSFLGCTCALAFLLVLESLATSWENQDEEEELDRKFHRLYSSDHE